MTQRMVIICDICGVDMPREQGKLYTAPIKQWPESGMDICNHCINRILDLRKQPIELKNQPSSILPGPVTYTL